MTSSLVCVFTCTTAMCKTVPCSPTASELSSMTTGATRNLRTKESDAMAYPHDTNCGCRAMNAPEMIEYMD